jgi:hypothetical protein
MTVADAEQLAHQLAECRADLLRLGETHERVLAEAIALLAAKDAAEAEMRFTNRMVETQTRTIAALRDALGFYAAPESYRADGPDPYSKCPAERDGGTRARKTLNLPEPE